MKSAAQWEKEYFSQPSDYPQGIAVIRAREIQAIQADALRHAAAYVRSWKSKNPYGSPPNRSKIANELEAEAKKLEAKP